MKDFDDLVGHLRHVEGVMAAMVDKIQRLESKLGIYEEDGGQVTLDKDGGQVTSPMLDNGPESLREASAVRDDQPSPDTDSSPTEPLLNAVRHNSTISAQSLDPSSGHTTSDMNGNRTTGNLARPPLPPPLYSGQQRDHRYSASGNVQPETVPNTIRHAMNIEAPEISRAPSLTDHHAALILEDLAFDRTNNVERQGPDASEFQR